MLSLSIDALMARDEGLAEAVLKADNEIDSLEIEVENLDVCVAELRSHEISVETVRVDEFTGKRFTFFADPDGLPLELYER